MNGLALARAYWERAGRPAFEARLPEVLEQAAVGLVGEGSECFGFDDALSRDHDWGPGFCIWLTESVYSRLGTTVQELYRSLPTAFEGWPPRRQMRTGADRVGCQCIPLWYTRYTGCPHGPERLEQWRRVPEAFLAAAVNGAVFQDPLGEFSAVRERLLAFYPEDVRLKKLAARLAVMAQAGQYNYPRCLRRGELVAAQLALAAFMDAAMSAVYLLNRRYAPFYKWRHRGLQGLERLPDAYAWFGALAAAPGALERAELVEAICRDTAEELRRQGLSSGTDAFLLPHAEKVQDGIRDPVLRKSHVMEE